MFCAIAWFLGRQNFYSFNPFVFSNHLFFFYGGNFYFFPFFLFFLIHQNCSGPQKKPGVLPKYLASLGDLPEGDHKGNGWISRAKIRPLLAEFTFLNEEPPNEKGMVYVQIILH